MACGTPVVAFRCGSVPEVIDDGITGYVVDPEDGLSAIQRAVRLDRQLVRQRFEERFTARRMAQDYMGIYERVGAKQASTPEPKHRTPILNRIAALQQHPS